MLEIFKLLNQVGHGLWVVEFMFDFLLKSTRLSLSMKYWYLKKIFFVSFNNFDFYKFFLCKSIIVDT